MYSVGYSGDSIAHALSSVDWSLLLSNDIPMRRIHINEKDENRNSIITLPVRRIRPTLPRSVIEGQYLSEMLNTYFYPTRNVFDFHQLPIPFECVAADIVTGETVVIKSGSLVQAVRASMAIPAVFSPVYLDRHVLVDGGLTRNFPVEEVKNMDADVVIGSYTGFRIMSEEEIGNVTGTLSQSLALLAIEDAKKQMEFTDILLDLGDGLKKFGAQSFIDSEKIIEVGRHEARKLLPQLLEIKQKQQAAGIGYKRKSVQPKEMKIEKITVSDIQGKPFSDEKMHAVIGIIKDEHNQLPDSLPYLNKAVRELYSHQFYSKVQYIFSPNPDGTKNLNLLLRTVEPVLQMALHYDSYESAGIVFRYKRNNLWLNNSRFIMETDLSQYGKTNISYLKYLNPKLNIWFQVSVKDHKQKYNNLNFRKISELKHFTVSSVQNNISQLGLTAGYSPSTCSAITLSVDFISNQLKKNSGMLPTIFNREDSASGSLLYKHDYVNAFLAYNQNTLDRHLFPTSGNKLTVKAGVFFNQSFSLIQPYDGDLLGKEYYELLNPTSYHTDNYKNPVLQFSIHEYKVLPVSRRISIHGRLFYGLNFRLKNKAFSLINNSEYMFLANKFDLGGYNNYRYENQIPFVGLQVKEFSANNLAAASLSLQCNVWKQLFITPTLSAAAAMDKFHPFYSDVEDNILFGAGVDFDYMTRIGPIKLSYSINSEIIPYSFFSLGYQF